MYDEYLKESGDRLTGVLCVGTAEIVIRVQSLSSFLKFIPSEKEGNDIEENIPCGDAVKSEGNSFSQGTSLCAAA